MFKITEPILYKYIFYPDILADDIKEYLSHHEDQYREQLEFLRAMKADSNRSLPSSIFERIQNKIDKYSSTETIILKRISGDERKDDNSEIFGDDDSRILIKTLTTKEDIKIYLPLDIFEDDIDIFLTLLPSEDQFECTAEETPIVVSPPQVIDEIIIVLKKTSRG